MMNVASIAFVVAVAAIMTGVGWPIVGALDRRSRLSRWEHLLIAAMLGAVAIYLSVFAVASVRLDGFSMWALLGLLSIAAAFGWKRISWRVAFEKARQELFHGNRLIAFLTIVTFGVGLSSFLQGLAPPNDYDSLMYHIALPRYDIEAGRLTIPYDRGLTHIFFPALGGHLSRLALATLDDGAAQLLHGLMGALGTLALALTVRRLGFGRGIAIGSALSFLSIRVVVWEMGTVEVDLLLASFAIAAMLVYLAWREHDEKGLAALFGFMIGGALATKYHGILVALSFAPIIIYDVLMRRRSPVAGMVVGPGIAFVVILPHLIRNTLITGNPLFPILNPVFNRGQPDIYEGLASGFGTGRGVLDLLSGPVTIFVTPMHYYDGMIFGAPYILALAPLVLLDTHTARRWLAPLSVAATYYLLWFYLVGQQVRFLLPAMPILAAVAVGGLAEGWRAVSAHRTLRALFVAILVVLVTTQSMFVGVYAALRLPAAAGLVSAHKYLSETPTMEGAFIDSCTFIREQLRPGETYFSLTQPHSYYCPQITALQGFFPDEARWWLTSLTPPPMSLPELVRRLQQAGFRFVLVPTRWENRRNAIARSDTGTYDLSQHRLGRHLAPVLPALTPVFQGRDSAVYSGPDVVIALAARLAAEPSAPAR